MFKEFSQGLSNFFTKDRIIILFVFIILAWALIAYSSSKTNVYDSYGDMNPYSQSYDSTMNNQQYIGSSTKHHDHEHHETHDIDSNHTPLSNLSSNTTSPTVSSKGAYALQPVANPADLLPNDQNSQWAELNPVSVNQGQAFTYDLLQAGYHIGLDTIGQSLRNANLQLRSDPIIPKSDVGPWLQSTIEPDLGRVPLELGNCTRSS